MKKSRRYLLALGISTLIVGAHSMAALASTAPPLGTAASYAILAGTPKISNTGNSTISGSVGIHPAASVTGFPPGTVSNGTIEAATTAAGTAKADLTAAYGAAASSPCNFDKSNLNLGGQILTPGTYCQTTAPTLTGVLTLNGNGVFIFQIGSTLVTAPGASVVLTGGAQACNVFWQVSSSATLDTTTTFVGTIMALTDISLNNGANIAGRALARNGQVTLINNQITAPTSCAAVTVPGPTPTPVPTATPAIGFPNTGGGPPSEDGLPWLTALLAALLAGAGSAGLVVAGRRHRRRLR